MKREGVKGKQIMQGCREVRNKELVEIKVRGRNREKGSSDYNKKKRMDEES